MKTSPLTLISICLFGITLLAGCVTVPPAHPQPEAWSAQRYYSEARQAQSSGNYTAALANLAELKKHYPESPYAPLIPLEIAYAHYQIEEYPLALQAAEQFINQQPPPAGLDYAYYLKGLIQSKLATPPSADGSTAEINPEQGRAAYQSFALLAKGYPDSQFRSAALKQMEQLRNQLADHEFMIVQQLLQQGDQEGARAHADYLIKSYPESGAASEAQNLIGAITPHHSSSAIHNEAWLLQQPPTHFTIQIAGTGDKVWLNEFVTKHQLHGQIAYYRSQSRGDVWYTLLYGNYASRSEAEAAIPELKSRLTIDDAWVQQFEAIQNTLSTASTNP